MEVTTFFEIQEASVIESSNTNESLATSATSQPMEVDVDETAAESTDEAGKPRPDQVEEDAKGRAGSGAEASAAKLRVGGAKDDASKVLQFSFCFFNVSLFLAFLLNIYVSSSIYLILCVNHLILSISPLTQ